MDYRVLARKKLKDFNKINASIYNLEERIAELNNILLKLDETLKDNKFLENKKTVLKKTRNRTILAEIEQLSQILIYRKSELRRIKRAFNSLAPNQQLILDKFYRNYEPNYLFKLMNELGYERRSIYYRKDQALRDFTLAMYGIIDA
jgi:hypothetical protein